MSKQFTKQEVYDRYRINESNFIVEILDDGIPMHYSTIVNRLNEQHETITRLEKENGNFKKALRIVYSTKLTEPTKHTIEQIAKHCGVDLE